MISTQLVARLIRQSCSADTLRALMPIFAVSRVIFGGGCTNIGPGFVYIMRVAVFVVLIFLP